MAVRTATWLGYNFLIHEEHEDWSDAPGIYIFAKRTAPNRWAALYVGQTTNFRERLATHEKWAEAQRRGATRIHARAEYRGYQRDHLEDLLIREYAPPLNQQRPS